MTSVINTLNPVSLLTLQLEKKPIKSWSYVLNKMKINNSFDFFELLDGSSPVAQDLGFYKIIYQNIKNSKIESLENELQS